MFRNQVCGDRPLEKAPLEPLGGLQGPSRPARQGAIAPPLAAPGTAATAAARLPPSLRPPSARPPAAAQYDTDVTTWSPQGRIFQIEYAMEAVKQGSAAVGLKVRLRRRCCCWPVGCRRGLRLRPRCCCSCNTQLLPLLMCPTAGAGLARHADEPAPHGDACSGQPTQAAAEPPFLCNPPAPLLLPASAEQGARGAGHVEARSQRAVLIPAQGAGRGGRGCGLNLLQAGPQCRGRPCCDMCPQLGPLGPGCAAAAAYRCLPAPVRWKSAITQAGRCSTTALAHSTPFPSKQISRSTTTRSAHLLLIPI